MFFAWVYISSSTPKRTLAHFIPYLDTNWKRPEHPARIKQYLRQHAPLAFPCLPSERRANSKTGGGEKKTEKDEIKYNS